MSARPALSLTCLGTSDAFGVGGRHCAGYLVESAGSKVLLDAGPSILSSLGRNDRSAADVDAVVVSHLHGDHFGGIPFLLLKFTFEEIRTRPLVVIGPPETEARTRKLYRALYRDASQRELPFDLRFVETRPGEPLEVADLRLEAFDVPHVSHGRSYGFRVSTGGRTIVYSGDTEWTDDLLRQSSGADLFLCECTSFAGEVQGHVRWRDVDANRSRLECRDLLLTHLGREMRGRGPLPDRLADDGLVVTVG
ncbi:MAG: MBL fold metallo-hydrolase [Alphaproteobacteria bacterium]